jgi:hypothetical protein
LSFYIQFFKHVNIALQCDLISTIEKKIALAKNVCSRPPIIIRSHDLHAGDIRRGVDEIASYHKRTSSLPSLIPLGYVSFWPFLAFPFVLCVMLP